MGMCPYAWLCTYAAVMLRCDDIDMPSGSGLYVLVFQFLGYSILSSFSLTRIDNYSCRWMPGCIV